MRIPVYKNNGTAVREEIHHSGISLDCSSSYYGSVYLGFNPGTMRVFGIGYEFSDRNGYDEAEDWLSRARKRGDELRVCRTLSEFIGQINLIIGNEKKRNDSLPMHIP